jgi:HSP20 family protein
MSLIRWRPGRELTTIRDEMNHLFDDFFSGLPERRREMFEGEWAPKVDIAETNENVVFTAELPGVSQDNVDITVVNDILTLKGEKKDEKEIKKENYHRIERSYGSFQRSVSIPAGVQADKAKAIYKDGVLTITIPKAEETKPKSIKINVE